MEFRSLHKSKTKRRKELECKFEFVFFSEAEIEQHIRQRRQVSGEKPRAITIEVAVYLDEDFTSTLKSRGITSPQQKLDFVILKWNWVSINLVLFCSLLFTEQVVPLIRSRIGLRQN